MVVALLYALPIFVLISVFWQLGAGDLQSLIVLRTITLRLVATISEFVDNSSCPEIPS